MDCDSPRLRPPHRIAYLMSERQSPAWAVVPLTIHLRSAHQPTRQRCFKKITRQTRVFPDQYPGSTAPIRPQENPNCFSELQRKVCRHRCNIRTPADTIGAKLPYCHNSSLKYFRATVERFFDEDNRVLWSPSPANHALISEDKLVKCIT